MTNLIIKELKGENLQELLDSDKVFTITFEQMSEINDELFDLFNTYKKDVHDMVTIRLINDVWFKISDIVSDAWFDGNKKVSEVATAIKQQLERLV